MGQKRRKRGADTNPDAKEHLIPFIGKKHGQENKVGKKGERENKWGDDDQ